MGDGTAARMLVYVSDEETILTVLNGVTGAVARTINLGPNAAFSSPFVLGGKLVVSGYSLEVYGL